MFYFSHLLHVYILIDIKATFILESCLDACITHIFQSQLPAFYWHLIIYFENIFSHINLLFIIYILLLNLFYFHL